MVLLPDWFPVNLHRVSAWSRTMIVPLSLMWAFKPVRVIAPEQGIGELFASQVGQNGPAPVGGSGGWARFFRGVDSILKACDNVGFRPLRSRAVAACRRWMLERFDGSDGLGAIFPPIVWSILALRAMGCAEDSAEVLKWGPYQDPTGLVRVRGVKLYMDGALGSRGAALKAPYSDRADTSGLVIAEHDPTLALMKRALEVRAQIAFHAIGDRANRMVLDWMVEAFQTNGPGAADIVWRVEHAQIIDPADIAWFRKSGVVASMQPSHAIGDLYFAPARLGDQRLAGAYAWKTLLDEGVVVAGGTDAPVEVGDPRIEFYAAAIRKDLQGRSGPDWRPEQALPRDEALLLFTRAGAYAVMDKTAGALKPGSAADITVFSGDILTIPEADILTVKPLLTIVSGKIVHDGR
jgi:predicted amidohydrolase YtcJ